MTRDEMIDLLVHHSIWFPMARGAEIEQTIDRLFHFARIVAAAEREACAKVCEEIEAEYRERESLWYSELRTDAQTGASECANSIRSR